VSETQPQSATQSQKPVSETHPQSDTHAQPVSDTQEQLVFDTQPQPAFCTQEQAPGTQLQVQTAPAGTATPHGTVNKTPFLRYWLPLDAEEEAATSMKHAATGLPCGRE
jgi:hypothetical protein